MSSCVIIVENLPVPLDRRVWQEAMALKAAGWQVSIICPKTEAYPALFEVLEDIWIYRHPLPLQARGRFAFLIEYVVALYHEARLLITVWRCRGFDVIQACNPPDLIFIVAAAWKVLGKKFVFDHHDVCPELFEAKFNQRGLFYHLLLLMEKLSFRTADLVISANETYRSLALSRGKKNPDDVVTVYSIPDRARTHRVPENKSLRGNARIVLGYVGIIGDQDGLDHLVHCVRNLVIEHGHTDVRAVVVGDGPALGAARALAEQVRVADRITFTGYLRGVDLLGAMSTFDIGLMPDPVNEYNDKISMNKVFEYSALGIPCVAYSLSETRRLLGENGFYADDPTPAGLARACLPLIMDEALRIKRGRALKALADCKFDWDREAANYVAAYERLASADKVTGPTSNTKHKF
jgi:glycosyltransferase involved in cell wall biosynthesis